MSYADLEKETREADMELLNQYRKELKDIDNNVGIARMMSDTEKRAAKVMLQSSIESYRGYLY